MYTGKIGKQKIRLTDRAWRSILSRFDPERKIHTHYQTEYIRTPCGFCSCYTNYRTGGCLKSCPFFSSGSFSCRNSWYKALRGVLHLKNKDGIRIAFSSSCLYWDKGNRAAAMKQIRKVRSFLLGMRREEKKKR
jgi:hypothetical protein